MANKYPFQQYNYFEVHHCSFKTYILESLDGDVPGDLVDSWNPVGTTGKFDSIIDAVNNYLVSPFSTNPRNWYFDTNTGEITTYVRSSIICGSYVADDFAKLPTKRELTRFEQGKQELYIVEFTIALQRVSVQDVDRDIAKAEGIAPI